MKIVLFLMTFVYSTLSFASIEGKWIGWAHWKYQGKGTKCAANLSFQETKSTFNFLKGHLDCDIVAMEIPERVFTKSDENLMINDQIVGKWSHNNYEWTEIYNERTVIRVSILVDGTHLDYHEKWIQDESTLLYDIQGRLFKE